MKNTALIVIIVVSFILASCNTKHANHANHGNHANHEKYIKVITNNSIYAALTENGTVITGSYGRNYNYPKKVKILKEVIDIYVIGTSFAAIYGKDKKLFVWTNPEHGQTMMLNSTTPLLNVHSVTISNSIYYGLIYIAAIYGDNNQVLMWGANTPTMIVKNGNSPLTNVKSIYATGGTFAAIYGDDSKVFTWDNDNSGNTVMVDESTKTPLNKVTSISAITTTGGIISFAAIYDNDNKVFVWASGKTGSIVMLDKTAKTPLTNVKSIFATAVAFAAIYGSDQKVFTWNSANAGSTVMFDKTAKIPLTNVKSIPITGSAFAAIYGNDYKVFTWIAGSSGKIVMLDKTTKTPLTKVKSISENGNYALYAFAAIYDDDNKVFIWGYPFYGGTFNTKSGTIITSNNTPLTNVTSIFAQDDGFAAIYNNQKNILIWGSGGIYYIKP